MSKETVIVSSVAIVFLIVFGFMVSRSSNFTSPKVSDPALLVREDSHMTGVKGAKVELVEFGDYQCPACAAASPIFKNVIAFYGENPDFNFVFRHFPLPQHANAVVAAEAAEAAGAQGKFWEMHEMLYEKQAEWETLPDPKAKFKEYATNLGLNVTKFETDLNAHTYLELVNKDAADGKKIPVEFTPSIYLNGELKRFQSELDLKKEIDEALKK